jgi:rubrerythrin
MVVIVISMLVSSFFAAIVLAILHDDWRDDADEVLWECHACIHLWRAEKSETCPRCGSEDIGA